MTDDAGAAPVAGRGRTPGADPGAYGEASRTTSTPAPPDPSPASAPDTPADPSPDQSSTAAGAAANGPSARPHLATAMVRSPFRFGFLFALGALLAYALFVGAARVSGPLLTVLVALFLAIGLDPAVTRLQGRGLRRGWAIAVVFLGFVVLLVGFVALILPPLVTQLVSLATNLPQLVDQLQQNETIRDLDERYQILDRLQEAISGRLGDLVSGALGAAQLLASVAFRVLTITILTLYFLAAFHPMKAMAFRLAPASRRERVSTLTDAILLRAGGYVTGQLVISGLSGVAAYLFLRAVQAPFASALALLIAVFSLIPMVGATIGAVVVTLVAATQSIALAVGCLVFFIVYQQVENYLIYPRVMKRAVNVHPAAALVGALIGGSLLGFVGAIIAVPVVAGIQLVIEEVVIPRQEQN